MCLESRYYHDDVTHSDSRIAIYYHTVVLGRSTVDSTKTPPRISRTNRSKMQLVNGSMNAFNQKQLTKLDSSGDAKLNSKTFTFTVSVPINKREKSRLAFRLMEKYQNIGNR